MSHVTVCRRLAVITHNLYRQKYKAEKLLLKWYEYNPAYLVMDFRSDVSSVNIPSTEKYSSECKIGKTAKVHIELICLRNYIGIIFDFLSQWSMCQLLSDTNLRFIEISLHWRRFRIAVLTNRIIRVSLWIVTSFCNFVFVSRMFFSMNNTSTPLFQTV
jgi:hypothetical protein